MKKVLFIATVVKTHIMEFHIPYLKLFKQNGWETAVVARNDYEDPDDCKIPFCDTFYDVPFERTPVKSTNYWAYKELKRIIDVGGYEIIHCHTPVGAMLARLAARGARKNGTKVIYTVHGFHFYKGAPLLNWLVYFPVEWILAHMTDVLITINKEDYARAQKMGAKKVCYVPGVGVDLSKFQYEPQIRNAKRTEIGLKENDLVLLSVGELIPRKNHEVVIQALAELKNTETYTYFQYLICGQGALKEELQQLARDLKVEDKVHFLGYRTDIPQLCNCSDLFVFMSLQEGLPVALMEAMACGLPVVCSNIRGNTDLIETGVNGCVCANTSGSVAEAIIQILKDPERRKTYSETARKTIEAFEISRVTEAYKKIYFAE